MRETLRRRDALAVVFAHGHPAERGTEDDAHSRAIGPIQIETAVAERLVCRGDGELTDPVQTLGCLHGQEALGIEALDLAGGGMRVAGSVEALDRRERGTPGKESVPKRADPHSERRQGAAPGDQRVALDAHCSVPGVENAAISSAWFVLDALGGTRTHRA